ncbi:MAG: sigma 54-interacting transcriptional regulator [Desulfitobacteriaceae bacterium]|nr:sigma 54-interacting transcriptional regulator [Desulfitobacteriaceae bacterium]MDI6913464.1 sigma 54-interacting transcriptional regulator [Desulfitobacteriaceae bacterium]
MGVDNRMGMGSEEFTMLNVLEAIRVGVIIIDKEEVIRFCNQAAADFVERKVPDILNCKIREVIPESELGQVIQAGKPQSARLYINGRLVITNRSPIYYQGEAIAAVAVFQDGSELQELLSRLDDTQSILTSLENIFENAYDGVIVVDRHGIITRITKAYCRFLHITQEEAVGKYVTEILPNSRMHIVAQSGEAEIGELMNIRGKEAMVMRIPLRENGQIVGAVGKVMFRDVQELRSLAKKLNLLENKLKFYEKELQHYQQHYRYTFSDIIGESRTLVRAKELADKAAQGKSTVLLRGESGTGKELFAHSIHAVSARHAMSFVRVNCGAIPAELLESELFGYEEGAFTGAKKGGKPGKFELAHGGTIFLDEVGDLPLAMQAKVLRVLQEKEVERVGGNRLQQLDIRVIAATHRDLEQMVSAGQFRQDLYYRLNVFTLTIPALREREGDILILSDYLLSKFRRELGSTVDRLEGRVASLFQHYHWPGNVRELQNVIERAVNVAEGGIIVFEDLPLYLRDFEGRRSEGALQPLSSEIAEAERRAIVRALKSTGGNKVRAAELLGIHRANLYRKIERYGIDA